jgi:hypothetical protein
METRGLGTVLVAIALATSPSACGGKASEEGDGSDSGTPEASTVKEASALADVARRDAAVAEAGFDAGLPPGAMAPHGTQLVVSNTVSVRSVTSDGYAVYVDSTTNVLYAIALTGGMPITIGTIDAETYPFSYGPVVAYWSNDYASLTIWTAAHGAQTLATASDGATIAFSSDYSHVVYVDGLNTSTNEGNLMVASTDGTGKQALVSGIQAGFSTTCFPQAAFAESTVLAAYCANAPGEAGAPSAALASFAAPTWAPTPIAMGIYPGFILSPSNADVLVGNGGGLTAYPLTGGPSTLIDSSGSLAATFTADSSAVVYANMAGALARSPVATPHPTTLVAGAYEGLLSLSLDSSWVLAYQTLNTNTYASDLYLASAATPGTATTLASTETVPYGSATFTTDSSHVVFLTTATSGLTNPLSVAPSTGGTPTILSQSSYYGFPLSGAKLVFDNNYTQGQQEGVGNADLDAVDTSQAAPPALLVTQADALFFVTTDKEQIVYSWSYAPGPLAGLWVMPAP